MYSVEGRNVVVKLLKRISFGMRDPELYAKKIMLRLVPMKFSPQVLTWSPSHTCSISGGMIIDESKIFGNIKTIFKKVY